MKKRILAALTAVAMLVAMVPCSSFAAQSSSASPFIIKQDVEDSSVKTHTFKIENEDEDEELEIEEAYEEIREEILDELEYSVPSDKNLNKYYVKSVRTVIKDTYTELIKMAKERPLPELGYEITGYESGEGWTSIVITEYTDNDFHNKLSGVNELSKYWGKEYITNGVDLTNVKTVAKKTIRSYFAVKDGVFNDYYTAMLNGAKSEYLAELSKAEDLLGCAVARSDARTYYKYYLSDYVTAPVEPAIAEDYDDDDDFWLEDDDDYWDEDWDEDEDESYDEYMEDVSGLGTMTEEEIEDTFYKDCRYLYDMTDWGNLPKSVCYESAYVTYTEGYMSIAEMKENSKDAKTILNLYVTRMLADYSGDMDRINEVKAEYIDKINSSINCEEQVQAFDSGFDKLVEISGVEPDKFNSRELGLMNKALSEAYDKYFVAGKYTKNGYKELYRLYASAYLNLEEGDYKMYYPVNYVDNVLEEMAEVPGYLAENKTAYTKKLNAYLGNSKYNQTKLKPIVKAGVQKIKKAETVKEVKEIYNEYKAKAEKTIKTFKITTSKEGKGTITASKTVKYGSSATITIKAAKGYKLSKLYVDGKSVKTKTKYTFKNVKKAHKIKAVFVKK